MLMPVAMRQRIHFSDWDVFLNTAGTELPNLNYQEFKDLIRANGGKNMLESYPIPKYFNSRINRYFGLER